MAAGFMRNCYFSARASDIPLISGALDNATIRMDGYAIIPVEEYHALNKGKGFVPEDHWPCGACGATGPTADGHDPCIANLPGVEHACCGHGYGHAYAMFSDGQVIRGAFDPSLTRSDTKGEGE